MKPTTKEMLEYFKEEYGIDTHGKDIDEILGINDLKLTPCIWEPYIEKAEIYLKQELKEFLLQKQKNMTKGVILGEADFRKYEQY